jgi:RNA polymerase sigma-70 factor (ECF subfamily)
VSEQAIRDACGSRAWDAATTLAIRTYGAELLGYIHALLRSPSDAEDVFATVCAHVWRALPEFEWHASLRTWAYRIARNACVSFIRGVRVRGSAVPISAVSVAAAIRTETATFLKTETKDALSELRASLDPDDQSLLILRLDRKLPWREVAAVFEGDAATPVAIERRAAALRKRLERLKDELRARLVAKP